MAEFLIEKGFIVRTIFLLFVAFMSLSIQGAAFAQTQTLPAGWSLVGNDSGTAVNVADVFGNRTTPSPISASVITVWSWNNALGRWNFFTPSMTAQELSTYAGLKNYGVLSSISKGEGFWVNAKTQFIYDPSIVATAPGVDNITGNWVGPGSDTSGAGNFNLNFIKNGEIVTGTGSACDTYNIDCFTINQINATSSNNLISGTINFEQTNNGCNGVLHFSANIIGSKMMGTYYGTNSCWGSVSNGIFSLDRQVY